MNKRGRGLALLLWLCCAPALFAATLDCPPAPPTAPHAKAPDASPYDHGLLWELRGPNGAVSHLYGTIHLSTPEITAVTPQVQALLVASRTFGMEVLLEPAALRDFSLRFGSIQASVTGKFQDPQVPEVGILSNIVEDGKPIGIADAGQDWHTDMSYRDTMGFVNVLNAHKVPRRDGKPLGNTLFANMRAAYDKLDPALKDRLKGMTATHDFNKFWEGMLAKGSTRGPLTPEQRKSRPPSVHPIFLTHPITGQQVLYCNPGYAVRINELDEA